LDGPVWLPPEADKQFPPQSNEPDHWNLSGGRGAPTDES